MNGPILAIEQRATFTRATVFSPDRRALASARDQHRPIFPAPGEVEREPSEIVEEVLATCRAALVRARTDPEKIAAIGIASQRGGAVLWDRESGRPLHRAITPGDRRTGERSHALERAGVARLVLERTGQRLDASAPALLLAWLLDNVEGARPLAEDGRLAFGTLDSFLLWRLTDGRVHATDATNAAATLLYNIHQRGWDGDLLRLFDVPESLLPAVFDSANYFGGADAARFGGGAGLVPIHALVGDAQASLIGKAGFAPGALGAALGDGGLILNTGAEAVATDGSVTTTIASQRDGKAAYALEAAAPSATSPLDWLRDRLGIAGSVPELEALAQSARPEASVDFVPAFAGLGSPWPDPDARAAILGMTADTGRAELVQAAFEAVAFQTLATIGAMHAAWDEAPADGPLRIDGPLAESGMTLRLIAGLLDRPVERPTSRDATALGAAWLAGRAIDQWPDAEAFAAEWKPGAVFEPSPPDARTADRYGRWLEAVDRVRR
ncbi:MAG: glycerol kinase [Bauldia sp.]|nr:glycerol kinase [Bauldia sp.]